MKATSRILAGFALLAVIGITAGFAVNINGAIVNALTGFQFNGAAPNNHMLCGNGTNYVDAAACGTFTNPNYQVINIGGVGGLPQHQILNFTNNFLGTDTNPSTTIDLATTITSNTAGNAATATNANAVGGVAITGLCQTSGTGCPTTDGAPSCNGNGCFRTLAGGVFMEEWGVSTAVTTGAAANNVTITFPHAFSSTANLSVVMSADACAQSPCSSGAKNPIAVSGNGDLSTSGITASFTGVIPTGGGGVSLAGAIHAHWHAYGPA